VHVSIPQLHDGGADTEQTVFRAERQPLAKGNGTAAGVGLITGFGSGVPVHTVSFWALSAAGGEQQERQDR